MKRLILIPLCFTLALSAAAAARKPKWVSGPDSKYPETTYMTGMGVGADLDAARSNARAEIARTFQARIQQTVTDQQTESSTSVGKKRSAALGTQKSQAETTLTTDYLLEGVTVKETYVDKKSKKTYALAVLDKTALRRSLSLQITEKEQALSQARTHAQKAATPFERTKHLSLALTAVQERDNLEARRRVLDPSGPMPTGQRSQIEAELEKTLDAIPVTVDVTAPEGSKLREAISAQLTALGVTLSGGATEGLALKATLTANPFDRKTPEWFYSQWSGSVEWTNRNTGKVIASATPDGVEGQLSPETARAKALSAGDAALAREAARLLSEILFN